jgi:hypothetical protein
VARSLPIRGQLVRRQSGCQTSFTLIMNYFE